MWKSMIFTIGLGLVFITNIVASLVIVDSDDVKLNKGVFTCYHHVCPVGTYQCTVQKLSLAKYHNRYVMATSKCISSSGYVIERHSDPIPNPRKRIVKSFTSVDINGSITSCNNCSNSKEANEIATKAIIKAQKTVQKVNKMTRKLNRKIRNKVYRNLAAAGIMVSSSVSS